jgi:phosphonate transport system substrate-binding protein
MRPKLLLGAVGLVATGLALVTGAGAADSTPKVSLKKVVVALKPDKNPDQMVAEKAALATYLEGALGVPAEVIIPLAAATIVEGFANGTIDLGYLSSSEMLVARDQKVADILLAGEIDGKTYYQSYWLALKEKPYESVADLRGKPVAFASKTSTSGYRIPLWDLHEKGLISESGKAEDFFGQGNVWFGTGYVSAVERVLNGDAEAAAVSDYVFDADKHLTPEQRRRLKKVAVQGPVPTHVIAVRASLSPADREALRTALEGLNTAPYTGLRDKVFTSRLIPVEPEAHLAPIAKAMQVGSEGP